jgi:hypothetical protein
VKKEETKGVENTAKTWVNNTNKMLRVHCGIRRRKAKYEVMGSEGPESFVFKATHQVERTTSDRAFALKRRRKRPNPGRKQLKAEAFHIGASQLGQGVSEAS